MTEAIPHLMELAPAKARIEAGLQEFQQRRNDAAWLAACLPVIAAVDDWKFSTGPLFDPPPYHMQLMGFSAGKLSKKAYAGVDEARVAGLYSNGFIGGTHRITVGPTKPLSLSWDVTLFEVSDAGTRSVTSKQPSLATPPSPRPASLVGISESSWLDERDLLSVGIGSGGAFAVYLYRHDANGRAVTAHMFSKGVAPQSDYRLHYDGKGELSEVTELASGLRIWPAQR